MLRALVVLNLIAWLALLGAAYRAPVESDSIRVLVWIGFVVAAFLQHFEYRGRRSSVHTGGADGE